MINNARENNFNIIRLVLSLMVIISHGPVLLYGKTNSEWIIRIGSTLSLGDIAVNSFFMLSGYLIVMSWHRSPNVWNFLTRRILRIYPGFIIAYLFSSLFVGWLGAADQTKYFSNLSLHSIIGGLILLKEPRTPSVFINSEWHFVNGALWTIRFEFYCYLMTAILGLIGVFKRKFYLFSLFAAVYLLLVVSSYFNWNIVNYNLFQWLRLGTMYLSGACVFLLKDKIKYNPILVIMSVIVLCLSLYEFAFSQLLIPILGAYVLFALVFAKNKILNSFGRDFDVSYGVYLYGWPIQQILNLYFPKFSVLVLIILCCLLSLLFASFSWRFVESPFLKLKKDKI